MTKNVIVHGEARHYIPKITTPINAVITDPPFGIDVQMNSASSPEQKAVNERIENDGDIDKALETFFLAMDAIIPKLAPRAEIYVFTAWNVLPEWMEACRDLHPDIILKMMLIWDKGYPGKGDLEGNWGCGYEPILYLKKGRRKLPYRRSGIIHVDKVPSGQNIHPTEKPVQLLEKLIDMSTDEGDLVVDPFSGSGSTSVAARNLNRNSLGFEIDNEPPRSFVDKSRDRLNQVNLFS